MAKLDRRRSFLRQSGFRDARLIGIACEGSLTELRYFEAVKEKLAEHPSRIHIELIKREEASKSAPKHVINSLDAFRKKVGFLLSDNFWAVIDYDRWGEKALSDAAKKIEQKGYLLAVSRPCFEAWLLLHLLSDNDLDISFLDELDKSGCKAIIGEIQKLKGYYTKELKDAEEYLALSEVAIHNAKKLDTKENCRWPQSFGSKVYLLLLSILKS